MIETIDFELLSKKPFEATLNFLLFFAERKGFEPSIPFRVYTLSRRAPSTTRTPLCISKGLQKYRLQSQFPNIFSALALVVAAISSTETFFTSDNFDTM